MATTATININVNSKQAEQSVDNLSGSINKFAGSANSLRTELRKVTQELQGLEPGSARFQELSARAGELRDKIRDTNAVINATAGNVTENFGKALTNSIQIGVAGFQALSSAQVLFGTENEDLQKTLAQMGALLNLSQAIETFGGLGDRLVEIKAGFTPILTQLGILKTTQAETAVATAAADAALVGEAVAADGAAVSTGLFATALNALPLVGIVTALGLLVAGLINYASASSDAEKQEKEAAKQRKILAEQTKALEKAQDEERKKVAESSVEYFNLIEKLKQTNAGSKERQTLINQINSQYGTTLKNLQDESAFQDQLNLSVKEYIALQVLKVRQETKKEQEVKAIQNLVKAQNELTKFEREYAGMTEKQISDYDIRTYGVSVYRDTLIKLNMEVDKAQKRAEAYAISSNNIQEEIDKLNTKFPKTVEGYKETTNKTKDATDANEKYAEVLDKVKNKLEREIAVQQTQEKLRTDRLTGLEKEIDAVNKLYSEERQSVIDRALESELQSLDEKFKKEGKSEQDYIAAAKVIRDNYQNYLLDSEKKLLEQLDQYQKEDLQNVQENYTNKEKIIQETTKNILTNTQLIQVQYDKEEEIRQIEQSKQTEEEKNKAKIEVRKKYAQQEIDLLNKNLEEQKRIAKLNLDETLSDVDKTASEKEQAQADYDQKIIQMSQQTADKINEINDGIEFPLSNEEKLQKSLNKINQYVDAVVTAFNSLSTTLNMIQDARSQREEARIEGLYNFEKTALENQLTENIITREQYDNKLKELDQQKEQETLQLRRQEFQSNKRLNMANAVIAGAQAVLQALGSAPPPINIILAALVGGLSAVQFGIISSQEFQAAGGGIVPGRGPGNVDSVQSLLAPGETVINAQSSQMYPELLNSINMAGGGVSLKPDLPATNKADSDVRVFQDNKINQPLRAYVVETDVTDTQRRVDRIKRSAEF